MIASIGNYPVRVVLVFVRMFAFSEYEYVFGGKKLSIETALLTNGSNAW